MLTARVPRVVTQAGANRDSSGDSHEKKEAKEASKLKLKKAGARKPKELHASLPRACHV